MDVKRRLFKTVLFCSLAVIIAGVSGCSRRRRPTPPSPPTPPGSTIHQLKISRFTTASLNSAEAAAILQTGTNILKTNDGPGDVSCQIELVQDGGIHVFSAGNGVINSASDFSAVQAVPGNIKIVNQINWCGAFSPNIIGCAPVPGNSLVVVRFSSNQEGILWDHEFGHNRGLSHRNDPDVVMNGIIGATHRRVNAGECTAYR